MLKLLTIKNYALIKELHLEPSAMLNIITGETGAGKSIMLGAVGLLLGNRADTRILMAEDEKCIVEGQFDLSKYELQSCFEEEELDYDKECIIRREISPAGKSRAFVNDTPVTLDVLKKLGSFLMDVHSQHETLLLGDSNFQRSILDAYAANKQALKDYENTYNEFKKTAKKLRHLLEGANQLQEEADYNKFLFEELNKANFHADEQEVLEAALNRLENAEEIKAKLNENIHLLDGEQYGIITQLHHTAQNMSGLSKFDVNYGKLNERLQSTLIELRDILQEITNEEEAIEYDPHKAEETKQRLSLLYNLQQKHKVSDIAALLDIQQQLDEKLQLMDNSDEAINKLKKELDAVEQDMLAKARVISSNRRAVCTNIIDELEKLLHSLGMPDAKVNINIEETTPNQYGIDEVIFLFSANKGIAPQNLKQVASGGEFSRLMFCFKYVMADKIALPTIVFDEIDTGISGEIALKMAAMMQQMSENHQVIAISHLPQIAAKGNAHYFVYKDNSAQKAASKIKELKGDERILAIAQMIGGDKPGESAMASAKELMTV